MGDAGISASEPRDAFTLLSRSVTAATVGLLVAAAGIAWYSTVRQAGTMSDMVSGLGQVGARMPNDMTVPVFLVMWLAMMVAMMFPTVAPIVLAHRMVIKRRGDGVAPTAAFLGGYLSVWTVIGLVPLAVLVAFRDVAADDGTSRWLTTSAGVVLAVCGAYQFTRWKAACLKACRTPLSFLMTHDFGGGSRSAYRAGLSHGAYCLGCCWALMLVLFVVGLMNLVWMAVIALVFLAEKNWRYGVGLTKFVGTTLILFGIAVVIFPDLLPAVAGASTPAGESMGDSMMMG